MIRRPLNEAAGEVEEGGVTDGTLRALYGRF